MQHSIPIVPGRLWSPRRKPNALFPAGFLAVSLGWFLIAGILAAPTNDEGLPPFSAVQQTVESHFAAQKGRQTRDLISRSEVENALRDVEKLGWKIEDEREILDKTLADEHLLVQTLRTPAGQKFMRQISGRELMYDRLDRISEVSGGAQLIRDIVKLPDGERYAKPKSGGGVPDLLDLLPKNASGQTRRIRDYHQPTSHLYTVDDLLTRLKDSHRKAMEKRDAAKKMDPGTQASSATRP